MDNNRLFRIAGWCAIVGCLLMVSFFVVITLAPASGIGEALAIAGVVVLTPVFFALRVAHRTESAAWGLAGVLLWLPAGALDIASLLNPANSILFAVDSVVFALPLLIFGGLAYQSARMPRGAAWMAIAAGLLFLISGVAAFAASEELGMLSGLAGLLMMLAWFVWLWRIFWSGKLAPVSGSTNP